MSAANQKMSLVAVVCGVTNSVELNVTQSEWDAMTEREQAEMVAEHRDDVVEIFVCPSDQTGS